MAVDPPHVLSMVGIYGRQAQNNLLDETLKILSKADIYRRQMQKVTCASKQQHCCWHSAVLCEL